METSHGGGSMRHEVLVVTRRWRQMDNRRSRGGFRPWRRQAAQGRSTGARRQVRGESGDSQCGGLRKLTDRRGRPRDTETTERHGGRQLLNGGGARRPGHEDSRSTVADSQAQQQQSPRPSPLLSRRRFEESTFVLPSRSGSLFFFNFDFSSI